ncbi:ATP-dependent DNA helicase PIF1-like protein [Tanacetum coccineum]
MDEDDEISNLILSIGNGDVGEDQEGKAKVEIPNGILIKDTSGDPIDAIINAIYPDVVANFSTPGYFEDRAILAPTNDVLNKIHERMMKLISTKEHVYLSSDIISPCEVTAVLQKAISVSCMFWYDDKQKSRTIIITDPFDVDNSTLKLLEFDIKVIQREINKELKSGRLKNLMAWNWDAVIDLSEDVLIDIDDVYDVEVYDYKESFVIKDTQGDMIDDKKTAILEDIKLGPYFKKPPIRRIQDLGLGWLLEEIHLIWAHLEKIWTRLRLYTKSLKEIIIQAVETASPTLATTSELDQDDVRSITTVSE